MACYLQFLTTGNVIACGISYGTSKYTDSRGWRVTIGFQLFLAVAIFFGAIICPESPFVLTKRNKLVEARQAIGILKNLDPESQDVDKAMERCKRMLPKYLPTEMYVSSNVSREPTCGEPFST